MPTTWLSFLPNSDIIFSSLSGLASFTNDMGRANQAVADFGKSGASAGSDFDKGFGGLGLRGERGGAFALLHRFELLPQQHARRAEHDGGQQAERGEELVEQDREAQQQPLQVYSDTDGNGVIDIRMAGRNVRAVSSSTICIGTPRIRCAWYSSSTGVIARRWRRPTRPKWRST
mgnify:CR=1 FL=1